MTVMENLRKRKSKQERAHSTQSAKRRLGPNLGPNLEHSKAKSSSLMKELTEEQSILLLNKLNGTLLAVTWLHLLPHRCNLKTYLLEPTFFIQMIREHQSFVQINWSWSNWIDLISIFGCWSLWPRFLFVFSSCVNKPARLHVWTLGVENGLAGELVGTKLTKALRICWNNYSLIKIFLTVWGFQGFSVSESGIQWWYAASAFRRVASWFQAAWTLW